jgi:hypothetical protein
LEKTPQSIAVGQKNKSLILAATLDSVVVIKDGKIASTTPVKYQPTSIALSVDETQVAVGGKVNTNSHFKFDTKIYISNITIMMETD